MCLIHQEGHIDYPSTERALIVFTKLIGLDEKSAVCLEILLGNFPFFLVFVDAHHWQASEVPFKWTEFSKWFFLKRLQFCDQLFLDSAYPSRDYFYYSETKL